MTQHPRPTVGDTVTVVRRIAAPPAAVVTAAGPGDSTVATLVAPPAITREGDSVRIAYTLAMWKAGSDDVVLPGAVVVDTRGHIDSLPDVTVRVEVASVLPRDRDAKTLSPRGSVPWLGRADRTMLPFVVLIPLALLIIALLQWRWRRRGPTRPPMPPSSPPPRHTPIRSAGSPPPSPQPSSANTAAASLAAPGLSFERIAAWMHAGELRLALDHVAWAVRRREDFADWRARTEAVRFAPHADHAIRELIDLALLRMAPRADDIPIPGPTP